MVGLPEETWEGLDRTIAKVIQLSPHFVRIHPTLVIKDTEMERMYRRGDYTPLTLEQTITMCKDLSRRLIRAGIPVARIGLQAIPEMEKSGSVVAGPFHPALGELVASAMAYDRMKELLARQRSQGKKMVIWVPERALSRFIGQHRQNLRRLRDRYGHQEISILPDKTLEAGELRYRESPGTRTVTL